MTAMPFADHSFDAVLAISVLHHVDLKEAAVQELRRVLRPRGLFSVSLTLAHCSACTTDQGMCARASACSSVCARERVRICLGVWLASWLASGLAVFVRVTSYSLPTPCIPQGITAWQAPKTCFKPL